jgi:hypothetical protein
MPYKVTIVAEDSKIEVKQEFDLIDQAISYLKQNLGHTVGRRHVESIYIDKVR